MTTNKPGVEIYEPSEKGATAMRKASFRNAGINRYVRLSDYERLQADHERLQVECEKLRKDAERYRHIRGGNQWIVAATQTGFHVDGEHLDELIDSEMEQ